MKKPPAKKPKTKRSKKQASFGTLRPTPPSTAIEHRQSALGKFGAMIRRAVGLPLNRKIESKAKQKTR
jgi:hypothetical protein